jgi:hypothetical protein
MQYESPRKIARDEPYTRVPSTSRAFNLQDIVTHSLRCGLLVCRRLRRLGACSRATRQHITFDAHAQYSVWRYYGAVLIDAYYLRRSSTERFSILKGAKL